MTSPGSGPETFTGISIAVGAIDTLDAAATPCSRRAETPIFGA
jgi:hypothetical protein